MTERTAHKQVHPLAVVYTVDQFCAMHAISRDKFYDLLKRGVLAAFKIGRRTYITKGEVERWLRETQQLNRVPIHVPVHVSRRDVVRHPAASGGKPEGIRR